MDKFLKSKSGQNITAHQRHAGFSKWTHVSGNKLFCTPCNIVLDHSRKSSVESHMKSDKHAKAKARAEEGDDDGRPAKKQRTLEMPKYPTKGSERSCQYARENAPVKWLHLCMLPRELRRCLVGHGLSGNPL